MGGVDGKEERNFGCSVARSAELSCVRRLVRLVEKAARLTR